MPYSGPNDASLPSHVKKKPLKKRRIWVRVFNNVFRRTGSDGRAMRAANSAAKEQLMDSKEVLEAKLKELPEDDVEQRAFLEAAIKGMDDEDKTHMIEGVIPLGWGLGGATTFAEADSWQDAQDVEGNVRDQKRMFDQIYANIWAREDLAVQTKTSLIQEAAAELARRTANPPERDKSFLKRAADAAKDWLTQNPQGEGGGVDPVNRFWLTKDATGGIRWVAVVSNNFYDRDEEVFKATSHKEYEAYLDGGGIMPPIRIWHTPGTDFGRADFMSFDDNFMLSSGLVTQGKEHIAHSLARSETPIAVSHGYRFDEKDYNRADGSYDKYRMFEISVLPADSAANIWTAFTVPELIKEVSMPIKPEKREFLVQHLGEERTGQIEGVLGTLGKQLTEAGIGWKDVLDEAPAADPSGAEESVGASEGETAEASSETTTEEVTAAIDADEDGEKGKKKKEEGSETEMTLNLTTGEGAEQFLTQIKEVMQTAIAPVSTAVVDLQARIGKLELTDAEKQANALASRGREPVAVGARPTESDANVANSEQVKEVTDGQGTPQQQENNGGSEGRKSAQEHAASYVEAFLLGGKSLRPEN